MVGEGAAHHRPGPHHDVPPEHRAWEDDHSGPQPTAAADQDRDVVRPLGVHHLVRVEVAVVLVRDVHVGSGVDVVTDLHLEMPDDVTPAPDHAPVADANHGIGDHLLPRHHAGGDAHVWTDEGVAPQRDPAFSEDRPGREGQAAAGAERPEPGGQTVAGADGAVLGRPTPGGIEGRAEPTSPGRGFDGSQPGMTRSDQWFRPGVGRQGPVGLEAFASACAAIGHPATLSDHRGRQRLGTALVASVEPAGRMSAPPSHQ